MEKLHQPSTKTNLKESRNHRRNTIIFHLPYHQRIFFFPMQDANKLVINSNDKQYYSYEKILDKQDYLPLRGVSKWISTTEDIAR